MDIYIYLNLLDPRKFKKAIIDAAKNPNSNSTLLNVLLVSFLSVILSILLLRSLPRQDTLSSLFYSNPLSAGITFVSSIILFYASCSIQHFIAKLLGGTGRFEILTYLSSLVAVSAFILTIPLFFLTIIGLSSDVISLIVLVATLLVSIYVIYMYYISLGVYSSISGWKLAGLYALSLIIVAIMNVFLSVSRLAIGI